MRQWFACSVWRIPWNVWWRICGKKLKNTKAKDANYLIKMNPRKKQLIIDNYPYGFSFEPNALRLVAEKIGEEFDQIDLAEMQREMFQRQNGEWLFVEQVADESTRDEIFYASEEWIIAFGCFALDVMQEKFSRKTSYMQDIKDFERFFEKLYYPLEPYRSAFYSTNTKIRIIRQDGASHEVVLEKLVECIKKFITEKFVATDYEIIEAIPALNRELLFAIVRDKLSQVIKTENNATILFQFADNHLPEDLPQKIVEAIEMLENCDLPLSQDNLHCTLSLLYETNFNETYQLPDMRTFRQTIEKTNQKKNYNWKNNVYQKND